MQKKFDLLWRFLDVPSGAVLGVMSGTLVIMALIAFFCPRFKIPSEFVTGYGIALSGVTVSGVAKTAAEKRGMVKGDNIDA